VPGRYSLPFREGILSITNDAEVHMAPSGGAQEYNHPLVHLENVEKAIDFGWYKLCHSRGVT